MKDVPLHTYATFSLSFHSLMGTYADSMTPIISGATINMVEQVCLLDAGFDSFGYIPKSGIAVLVF
jgi:hypothetical protein